MIESKRAFVAELVKDVSFCTNVGDFLAPLIWQSTIPLIAAQDGTLRQHGTGTLFTIAQRHFLVTAAHVLNDARKASASLHVLNKSWNGMERLLLNFKRLRPNSFDDSVDLAMSELDPVAIDFLKGHRFVQLLDVDTNQELDDDLYCLCGFPTEGSLADESGTALSSIPKQYFLTYLYRGSTALTAYDSRYNILLHANRSDAVRIAGGSDMPQSLRGMSGCGIWKTNLANRGQEAWTPADARIVAVQTGEYMTAGAVKGTSWKGIANLISEGWPELRPSLTLLLRR